MKVKLLRDIRPFGRTGETIDVSPEHFDFLMSLGLAEQVAEVREQAEAPKTAEEPKVIKRPAKAAAKEEPKVLKKPAKKK